MNFQKKLFSFFMVISFVLSCGTINTQEITDLHAVNGDLQERVLPDPYKEYLKTLPLMYKIWNAIGSSNVVTLVRHFRGHDLIGISNEFRLKGPVSQEIYKIAEEAQLAVGISEWQYLPVGLQINSSTSFAVATTMEDVIVFDENCFNRYSYGYNKVTACHEAIHVKYYHYPDKLIAFLAGALSVIVFDQVSNVLTSEFKYGYLGATACTIFGVIANCVVASKVNKSLKILNETRADTEGAFASRCGHCVSEAVKETDNSDEYNKFYRERGYLTASELDAIAEKLRDYSCEFHKKQNGTQNPV